MAGQKRARAASGFLRKLATSPAALNWIGSFLFASVRETSAMLLVCKHESVQELLGGCRQLLGGCRQLLIKRSFVNAEPVSLGLSRRMGSWFAAIENLDLSGLNRQLADGIVVRGALAQELRYVTWTS